MLKFYRGDLMKVTCCVTKTKIEKSEAYVVVVDGKNKYYKDKATFEEVQAKEDFYFELKMLSGMRYVDKFPVEILSYFTRLNTSYTWKELLKVINFKRSDIIDTKQKDFNSTTNKLLYISKIIESGLVCVQGNTLLEYEDKLDEDLFLKVMNNEINTNRAKPKRGVDMLYGKKKHC